MSETAVVSPYDPQAEKVRNEMAIREEQAVANVREEARKNRLSCPRLPLGGATKVNLSSTLLTLNTGSTDFLKEAAQRLGYKVTSLGQGRVALQHPDRSVIEISKTKLGKVILSSPNHDLRPSTLVVKENNAKQIYSHLKSRGMSVQAKRTPEGEVIIDGFDEKKRTRVRADIRQDGIAVIDVLGMKGKRCQEIIRGISRAIQGAEIDTLRKKEFFMETEEEVPIRV